MSSLILSYLEGGQVTEALQRYVKNRNCAGRSERFTRKYGLDHTGGLFIILLSAMFVGAFLLVVELCVFRYLVPYLRKKPNDSLWKNRNIEYVNQVINESLEHMKYLEIFESLWNMNRFGSIWVIITYEPIWKYL